MGLKHAFVTRVILAAGAGSRMGRTKALLPFGGRTALDLVADLVMDAPASETVVVCGHDAERVAAVARTRGLRPVVNERWRDGQTGSLQTGLAAAAPATTAFLLHPVDLPLIRQEDYDACLAAFAASDREIAVASHDRRRGHPLIFAASLREAFMALAPDAPARDVLRARPDAIEHVVVANPWVIRDLDTPEDYARALE